MKGYHDSKTPETIRDLWRTPKAVFDYYDKRFNFGYDLAASKDNSLCDHYYSEENSAFNQDNEGFNAAVWCNPPYSNITPWVMLCIDVAKWSNQPVAILIPADTSVKWFKLAYESCTECHFISGRLAFINEDTGKPVSGNNKGSVVFVFDPRSPVKQAVSLIERDEVMGKGGD